ncbi:MAG: hypothetical protein ABIE55_03455 [Candidatus Aenigmatarchaeota archaeon]
MAKRKAKKKRTAKSKVVRKRVTKKKDSRMMSRCIFTGIMMIILFALLFSMPSGNNGLQNQEQTQDAITDLVIEKETIMEYACKSNLDCLLINCKNTPDNVECVNSIATETYYENCDPAEYWNVDVDKDYDQCSCVAGICK